MKRLTRQSLLKTMVELLKNRKPSSSSYQAGYEDALRDLAAEFRLSMKDGEAKANARHHAEAGRPIA